MGGNDILLNRIIAIDKLVFELANIFQVPNDTIYIPGHTPDNMFSGEHRASLVVVITDYGGDFSFGMAIATGAATPDPKDINIIRQICRHMNCSALIEPLAPQIDQGSDEVFWLVTTLGQVFRVEILPELLNLDPPQYTINEATGMKEVEF